MTIPTSSSESTSELGTELQSQKKRGILSRLWHPSPASSSFAIRPDGEVVEIPEESSSWSSRIVFHWITPLLWVGYTRPLQLEDLWKLPNARLSHTMADRLGEQFYKRVQKAKQDAEANPDESVMEKEKVLQNEKDLNPELETSQLESTSSHSAPKKTSPDQAKSGKSWIPFRNSKSKTAKGKKADEKKEPNYSSIFFAAMHSTLLWRWWAAGICKLIGDTLQTTSPLINKALLSWLSVAFAFHHSDNGFIKDPTTGDLIPVPAPRGIGYGIGLVIALFAMQELSSLATNQYQILTMTNGMAVRAGVISLIFRKSLRLSNRARAKHSTGQITTLISTDATRLDLASALVHNLWINPIQISIGIGLLIGNLKVSALVGLAVLLVGFPIQGLLVKVMITQRKKGVGITDQRVRVTTEVLQGIRLIKLYAWEMFYGDKINALREREVSTIRKRALARASLLSLVTAIPIVASVLSFITYALTGHALEPAIIFSSLQFLNIIRLPLAYIPFVFSICADAYVALSRIGNFLTAEELEEGYRIDDDPINKWAVKAEGDFVWEEVVGTSSAKGKGKGKGEKGKGKEKEDKKRNSVLPVTRPKDEEEKEKRDEKPFELNDVNVRIPKGSFVAIVGRVGSGKSSLLQAMIGEMRRVKGDVVFGGPVAYVPQTPWIMNATLRDNILFGREADEEFFEDIIKACSLEHDLEMLPNAEMTEIGEKGINLSGGQKARVSLARAAYSDSSVILLDDPLSAVDAHVGRDLLHKCLLSGPLANKTRILVTHALHVLQHTDYVYVMDAGKIVEEGTYHDLIANGAAFSRLVEEFGSQEEEEVQKADEESREASKELDKEVSQALALPSSNADPKAKAAVAKGPALMQQEERNVGQVEWVTYAKYLKAAGTIVWAPVLLGLLTLSQGSQVGNNLFLGFWTAGSIPGFKQGQYIAVYAALGVAQGIFSFIGSFAFSLSGLSASLTLFKMALKGVIRSPVAFYDTTPIGRILSRLSKDQDVMDNQLADTMYQLLATFSNILGTVGLVFYTFPYLGIIFAPLSIIYWACATFYRRSSVEAKRLDSVLRSALYASYSETLTGLSTVRAYREQDRFIRTSEHALDVENRAYYITIAIQRWLGVRLDILGNILILGIGIFSIAFRETVDPSKIGVVLSYTLLITQSLSQMVTQFAQTEQNMNSVERVIVYSELPSEGDLNTPNDPPPSWPTKGAISFNDVSLAYRPGLPLVLKGVSFEIKGGEKVGVVGRTGAGKSSLLQALLRIVELREGSIVIDGVDCRHIGLEALRRQLAVIPQDSVLFLGTLRDNLDPTRSRTDAELISALQRAWLLPQAGVSDPVAEAKYSLDTSVGDEGSNFSAGERQLVALCRALVKDSKIIILDEATSNVDVETDSKLQTTIQREFASSTLFCIAHRLNTIVYYDRVLVMDAGKVAEFDTPLNLYDRPDSVFRSLCDEANLSRQDILKIRNSVQIIAPVEV
ncbi:hypothetical protein M422DRAFT_225864 [Sphaerobolus stellatus SS14]|nr:hypothetical protein M422DRAFT_225864 [Sphaerobolus stellatus SS14]